MIVLRQAAAIVLIIISGAGIVTAGWTGLNFQVPEMVVSFEDADKIHKSVYMDNNIQKLLQQNLRMQEAIFSAQKQGIESILQQQQIIEMAARRAVLVSLFLIAGSVFCLALAFFVFPREVRLHKHTLAQMEMLIWHGMVVDNDTNKDDEFAVKESAYPVHLCGCSGAGLPVHLCGCSPAAIPVHLCKCGCWG
jgi:hypothetical protein